MAMLLAIGCYYVEKLLEYPYNKAAGYDPTSEIIVHDFYNILLLTQIGCIYSGSAVHKEVNNKRQAS